jgi:site-specific DNA recombinase
MANKEKTAIIYARVSTKRQADDGLPIESQLDRCRGRAEKVGSLVVSEFADLGISGTVEMRPQFQAAINYCEKNKVDYFITWSTSRFARDKHDSATYKRRLDVCGTRLIYVSFEIDRDSHAGFLTEGVMELMDEFYSRQISEDTSRSMVRNAQNGYFNGGRPAYGFEVIPAPNDKKRKKLKVNKSEAKIVKEIFKLRLEGMGAKSIAGTLNEKNFLNRKLRWHKQSVLTVLKSHAVIGKTVFGKKSRKTGRRLPQESWIITKSHEAIIEEEFFHRIQNIMKLATNTSKNGSPLSQHLFTGMMVCGECSSNMRIERATGWGKKVYSYYNCSTAMSNSDCKNRRIPADVLDDWLIDVISKKIFCYENLSRILKDMNEAVSVWSSDNSEKVILIKKEINELNKKNENLYEIIEVNGSQCDAQLLVNRMSSNDKKTADLNEELINIENTPVPDISFSDEDLFRLKEFLSALLKDSVNKVKIRTFLSSVIQKVLIKDTRAIISYMPDMIITNHENPFIAEDVWLPGTGSNCRPSD